MTEQEIKLHITADALPTVAQAFAPAPARPFHAQYFDTPDRQLAKAKTTLRLRLEGEQWVQTLKMAGSNSLSRLEINHPRPGPELDLSLYQDTAAQALLQQLKHPLQKRYETLVQRKVQTVTHQNSLIELAFDSGVIRTERFELPLCELELELLEGNVHDLIDLAQQSLTRWNLVVDMRSKSQRGDALANMNARVAQAPKSKRTAVEQVETQAFWQASDPLLPFIHAYDAPKVAYATLMQNTLEHLFTQAIYLANIDTQGVLDIRTRDHAVAIYDSLLRLEAYTRWFGLWVPALPSALASPLSEFRDRFFGALSLPETQPGVEHPPRLISLSLEASSLRFQSFLLGMLDHVLLQNHRSATEPFQFDTQALTTPLEERLVEQARHIRQAIKQSKLPEQLRPLYQLLRAQQCCLHAYDHVENALKCKRYQKTLHKATKGLTQALTYNETARQLTALCESAPTQGDYHYQLGYTQAQLAFTLPALKKPLKKLRKTPLL